MQKIMFNDKYFLTQAVLNGTKTMTRRLLKDGTPLGNWEETEKHLPYKVGEVVAISQSYKAVFEEKLASFGNAKANEWWYKAIGSAIVPPSKIAGYKNKMFTKASLMPHHIRITDVKIERLQDISKEDILCEGIFEGHDYYTHCINYRFLINGNVFDTAQQAFATLIDKVGKKGDWENNPWVVAYNFELVD